MRGLPFYVKGHLNVKFMSQPVYQKALTHQRLIIQISRSTRRFLDKTIGMSRYHNNRKIVIIFYYKVHRETYIWFKPFLWYWRRREGYIDAKPVGSKIMYRSCGGIGNWEHIGEYEGLLAMIWGRVLLERMRRVVKKWWRVAYTIGGRRNNQVLEDLGDSELEASVVVENSFSQA